MSYIFISSGHHEEIVAYIPIMDLAGNKYNDGGMQIENKFVLSIKFSVEGPLRIKEEYLEGIFETPKVNEDTVPEQLRGALDQAINTLQQLPVPIRDTVSRGLKIPLGEAFQRLIMISYLDEEILIVRNTAGEPEVLTRLDPLLIQNQYLIMRAERSEVLNFSERTGSFL